MNGPEVNQLEALVAMNDCGCFLSQEQKVERDEHELIAIRVHLRSL